MTPEQLAQVRQWAEWGETPTPETTIALLDHIDWLTDGLIAHAKNYRALQEQFATVTERRDHYAR